MFNRFKKLDTNKNIKGFALPTVLITSLIMLVVLMAAVSTTVAVRTSLSEQLYSKLAKNAAEAGIAYATACLKSNNNQLWLLHLHPDTDCNGSLLPSCPVSTAVEKVAPCHFVMYDVNLKIGASFDVAPPTIGQNGRIESIKSSGSTKLIDDSNAIWKEYIQTSYLNPQIIISPSHYTASVLVVGGGGAGGYNVGGGGGGGAVIIDNSYKLNAGLVYTVTVGDQSGYSQAGKLSIFSPSISSITTFSDIIMAFGGGRGGNYTCGVPPGGNSGGNGANSGGGAGGWMGHSNCDISAGIASQGNTGGEGLMPTSGDVGGGGGGGGAGENGHTAIDSGGNGGAGLASSISGTYTHYGGGGGGGSRDTINNSSGGIGGGGNGVSREDAQNAYDGANNTGGGGGGHGYRTGFSGGRGGSGIVIISYKTGSMQGFGGVVTYTDSNNSNLSDVSISGGYTIHTFESSGSFSVIDANPVNIRALIVGGGGGGGSDIGGGGAGGSVNDTMIPISLGEFIITVGSGGSADNRGGNSNFVASYYLGEPTFGQGGGAGGRYNSDSNTVTIMSSNPDKYHGGGGGGGFMPSGPEYLGGIGWYTGRGGIGRGLAGGGGGGTGGLGNDYKIESVSDKYMGGDGGLSVTSDISGSNVCYGGGGGGGGEIPGLPASGCGGGAGSARPLLAPGYQGVDNKGGGGGGSGSENVGGKGGLGIVIISYPEYLLSATGGTESIVNGNKIHTFKSVGTSKFTVTEIHR